MLSRVFSATSHVPHALSHISTRIGVSSIATLACDDGRMRPALEMLWDKIDALAGTLHLQSTMPGAYIGGTGDDVWSGTVARGGF